ncbi:MAG TPA: primosomal protein N' [Actinobacteria bacterium]|nr:primosomal protein N' [Actinomycetota bacterium]
MSVAKVALDLSVPNLRGTYNYLIPEALANTTKPGSTVVVPVRGRECLGYIVEIVKGANDNNLKSVLGTVDSSQLIGSEHMQLCRWLADYYLANLNDVLRLTLPPGARPYLQSTLSIKGNQGLDEPALKWLAKQGSSVPQRRLESKFSKNAINKLLKSGRLSRSFNLQPHSVKQKTVEFAHIHDRDSRAEVRGPKQQAILAELREKSPISVRELLSKHQASRQTLKMLATKGLVKLVKEKVERQVETKFINEPVKKVVLNGEQNQAVEEITGALLRQDRASILIEGVTGSGKTEVYIRAAQTCLKLDKSAIFLVPEIALLPQLVERLALRFGDQVAVLHSGLKTGERFDAWHSVASGRKKLIVGARSALFAPVKNLGLIVIDEEHEMTYKQNTTPRYDARTVARKLADLHEAVFVMGSATPSLESQTLVESKGKHLKLTNRVVGFNEPTIKIVDMREAKKVDHEGLFSRELYDGLRATLDRGNKAVLLLNRRGFANFLLCRKCGYVPTCANCAVSLRYHKSENRLRCHHCDSSYQAHDVCPECQNSKWRLGGVGTERVEGGLRTIFPNTTVIRMDSDTTSRRGSHHKQLLEFNRSKRAVLLGTQMIAKGLDFPEVELVGIINADTALNLPDFRAGERTAQLLTQVSGRSGRGPIPGKVIIQTFDPENYAIKAVTSSYSEFCDIEKGHRRALGYPPFSSIINIIVSSQDEVLAESVSYKTADILRSLIGTKAELLGPAPAPIAKIKGSWRWHLMIVTKDPGRVKNILRNETGLTNTAKNVKMIIDIDPVWLL